MTKYWVWKKFQKGWYSSSKTFHVYLCCQLPQHEYWFVISFMSCRLLHSSIHSSNDRHLACHKGCARRLSSSLDTIADLRHWLIWCPSHPVSMAYNYQKTFRISYGSYPSHVCLLRLCSSLDAMADQWHWLIWCPSHPVSMAYNYQKNLEDLLQFLSVSCVLVETV